MDKPILVLERTDFKWTGIFGRLKTEEGEEIAKTLEHSYPSKNPLYLEPEFLPKVPSGTFNCVRGIHELAFMKPFETFEVTNVPGRRGILFHVGNENKDSSGCILVGEQIENERLLRSVKTFVKFMDRLKGIDEFSLLVI